MWKWRLSQMPTAKAQASLHICAVSPVPSLFTHSIWGATGSFRQRAKDLSPIEWLIMCIWAISWQNQQYGICTQRRLRSAWASSQSDQSLRCDQTGQMPRLIWVFAGRTCHFVGFIMRWLIWRITNWIMLRSLFSWTGSYYLSLVTRKPVFGICDQVRLKPACSATETS